MGVNVGKPTYDDLLETLTFLVSALESQNPQPQMSMSVRINMSNARKLIVNANSVAK
jgi:hypothetical protein